MEYDGSTHPSGGCRLGSIPSTPTKKMEKFIITAILVFLAVVLSDVLWVLYIRRVNQGKALGSAIFGTIIWLFGAFVVINYLQDKRQIIFAILGSFIGTYLAVIYDSRKRK